MKSGKTSGIDESKAPLQEKTIAQRDIDLSKKPRREDFETFEEYDKALLDFQTANMKALREKYPNAYYGGEVFYGTHLPPEEVFKNGIPEKGGGDFDLRRHQTQQDDKGMPDDKFSGMRGSCVNAMVPAKFAGEGNYVYKLRPIGGAIDLDAALSKEPRFNFATGILQGNLMPGETEMVMGSRQPGYVIEGCYKVGAYVESLDVFRLGEYIKNPNFDPDKR